MANTRQDFASAMTWTEVDARLRTGAAAILPVGAGAKQHGFHMPMSTDQIQAEWFAARLAEAMDAIIWPTVTYGWYPAFAAYAGSVSISETTFEFLVRDIVTDLARFGARRIFILNTGVSTIAPIDRTLNSLAGGSQIRHLPVYSGPRYRQTALELCEQSHGSHADEAETSIMMALRPDLVATERAASSPAPAGGSKSGPLTPTDVASPNYSPSGSFGDPTLATTEKGFALIEAIMGDLVAMTADPDKRHDPTRLVDR